MIAAIRLEEIEHVDQRAGERFRARGSVVIDARGLSTGGVLRQISRSGVSVRCSAELPVDESCSIVIIGLGDYRARVVRRIAHNAFALEFIMSPGESIELGEKLNALYNDARFIILDC